MMTKLVGILYKQRKMLFWLKINLFVMRLNAFIVN